MITTIVHVEVNPARIDDFIRATIANHLKSVKEAGNLRFDVLQKGDNPAQFALYEAYEDEASAAAHKQTAHYQEWKDTVAPWMAKPREGVRYKAIIP
jgi:autoinducer 2-degrading protein